MGAFKSGNPGCCCTGISNYCCPGVPETLHLTGYCFPFTGQPFGDLTSVLTYGFGPPAGYAGCGSGPYNAWRGPVMAGYWGGSWIIEVYCNPAYGWVLNWLPFIDAYGFPVQCLVAIAQPMVAPNACSPLSVTKWAWKPGGPRNNSNSSAVLTA